MNIRERMHAFWAGERPDVIPYTIYWNELNRSGCPNDPAWTAMLEQGLGVSVFGGTVKHQAPDLKRTTTECQEDGCAVRRHTTVTPVGELVETYRNGWHAKYTIETPDDYRVMTWIAEHTEIEPRYDEYLAEEKKAAPHVIMCPALSRTPIQHILVDYVGLENFGVHLYEYEDEMRVLYDAIRRNFRRQIELVAEGPGHYIEILENFTAETLGPKRYEQFLLPVYEECFGILHDAGKIVGCHFDGKTASCRDVIARSPIDLIESFTPPPEGDLSLAEARAAWPEKLLLSNINIGAYQLPASELRRLVLDRVAEGAPDGRRLAFEVSEELPANWRESMPVVLDALNETRG